MQPYTLTMSIVEPKSRNHHLKFISEPETLMLLKGARNCELGRAGGVREWGGEKARARAGRWVPWQETSSP
jgi:hypothetical protein